MSGLLVPCRRCGRQVDSTTVRQAVCLECRLDGALAELRAEHARLWRKRERYRSAGGNAAAIASQIARTEDRMAERIRELVPAERAAAARLRQELERARQARYLIGGA